MINMINMICVSSKFNNPSEDGKILPGTHPPSLSPRLPRQGVGV